MTFAPKEIGNRLFKIRFAIGMGGDRQQQKFAHDICGVPKGTYNHWETGKGAIPAIRACRMLEHPRLDGLTLDWLYLGITRGLTFEMAERLRAAPERPDDERFTAPPSKRSRSFDREAAALLAPLPPERASRKRKR